MVVFQSLSFVVLSVIFSLLIAKIVLTVSGHNLNKQYIYYGMSIFFIGIGLHSLIALPVIIYQNGFKVLFGLKANIKNNFAVWEFIYFGFAAGIGQEISKLIPIKLELRRTKGKLPKKPYFPYGLNIGLGFSLSEILFIAIMDFKSIPKSFDLNNITMGSFERVGATIFHMATASIIASGIERGKVKPYLIVAIFLHAIIDSFLIFFNNQSYLSDWNIESILFGYSIIILVLSLFLAKNAS